MENSMAVLQKIKTWIMIHQFYFWTILPKRIESSYLKRYLYIHVHSSIVHNSQKVEATTSIEVSIEVWMDKQNVVCYTLEYYST